MNENDLNDLIADVPVMHLFGDEEEWGISLDDGCLRFHPNVLEFPDSCSEWVWHEAWEEVERMGGFDAMVRHMRLLIKLQQS